MARKVSDFLLASDLDNTLITGHYNIPQRNIDAIERFRAQGGKFTIATGRSIRSAQAYAEQLKLDTPAILCNGGMLYDYVNHKELYTCSMPDSAHRYAYDLFEKFPDIGSEAYSGDEMFVIKMNEHIEKHLAIEGLFHKLALSENAPGNWTKAIFAADTSTIQKMLEYVDTFEHDEVDFITSGIEYFEMLPKGVAKGNGLKKLAEILNIPIENTVAVGDYYNDLSMVQAAGTGVFVENAPDELKPYADMLVCSCPEGAVAEVIEYIFSLCR